MKRYLMVMGGMILLFLALFFLVEALGVPLLVDPTPWLNQGGLWAAALGVGLLIADVLLPVPSSLVMVAHGALFGVAIGTLLSLLGSTGAAVFGFWIGRRGGKWLERLVPLDERDRANRLLERWGLLAVVVTRPIPLLAETVAIMAGASPLGWLGTTLAALAGSLPPALLYALTGASAGRFQNTTLMFLFVMVITGIIWMLGRKFRPLPETTSRHDYPK
ncbi:MAG: hypothetical protein QOH88_3181 [Verrucomicrobiota bacterium]|jgi:uncharacterized membrane protein YdjX (TVP38/TMEM64 family)